MPGNRFNYKCPHQLHKRDLLQGSSIGVYTTQWMNEFHWSARGETAEDWLDEPKKRREKLPYPPVKVVFPTKKTVKDSIHGESVREPLLALIIAPV